MIGIGSSVGHYVVRAKLGEGAMGTVYLAQHHVLDARVAIKVIRRDAERTEEDVSRFFTEARSASRIGHENIVGVLDFGRTADGDPYYIMELLTGESLAARLAQGRRPLAEVLHVATRIADALAASHGKGIVHRDLKPGNVFLVRRGGDARFVKVLDFGVAKLTEEEAADEQRGHRTNTGRLLGTPHYMAPEQVAGRRSLDGRADVYALGVLLFEMLCGRLPFDAPKWTEVLIQHVTQPPPRVRDLVADCPAWLNRLVDRALGKTPGERPSMAELCAALRAQDDAQLAPVPHLVLAPSLPPTSAADAPTLASETLLASADTVASDANAKVAAPRRRAWRGVALLALALGAGGTALGAVVVELRGTSAVVEVAKPSADVRPSHSFGPAIERVIAARKALEDAGVAFEPDEPALAPRPLLLQVARLAPRPDAAVPLPDHIDGFDVEHALAGSRDAVAACNDDYVRDMALDVSLTVGGDGDVIDVRVPNRLAGTPFAMCVERVIKATARFPRFAGAAQDVDYSYGFAPEPPR